MSAHCLWCIVFFVKFAAFGVNGTIGVNGKLSQYIIYSKQNSKKSIFTEPQKVKVVLHLVNGYKV